jgi:rhodanese-related sulfurtransferase
MDAGSCPALIDVRTPAEHAGAHVPGVVLMPLERLDPARVRAEMQPSPERPLHLLCKAGGRARQAGEKLEAAGVGPCVVVEGGTDAWVQAGYPVNRGEVKVISLERQVRIAAGCLVAAGTALGVFQHPGFLAIPALVGCGLIFAGVTDWCGMGLLLARMPWNQRAGCATGSRA